jgi:DNA-binding transcriptional MocR family regulator
MTPDREELAARFAELDDADLLGRIESGDLTALAQEVAIAEAHRRGLAMAALRADAEGGVEVTPGHGPLKICTRFLLPVDAHLFAARLIEEGIAARVMGADTIYAVGAFMGSLARGGVRVMVPESQFDDAQRVLAAFDAGEYAIDENFDPNS